MEGRISMNERAAPPLREPSTRWEILMLLKKHGSVSVQEMSDYLGLTGMAIRRHLNALQKEKYIRTSNVRHRIGRPLFVDGLSVFAEPLFPNQYDVLATELMDELHDMFDDSFVGKLFERRMKSHNLVIRKRIESFYTRFFFFC